MPKTPFWVYAWVLGCMVALMWCVNGCTSSVELFHVDERFTLDEVQQIRDAVDLWEVATDHQVQFDLATGYRVGVHDRDRSVIVRATEDEALAGPGLLPGATVAGYTETHHGDFGGVRSRMMALVPSRFALSGADVRRVAAHEFGHAAGIEFHLSNPAALMNASAPDGDRQVVDQCLSADDFQALLTAGFDYPRGARVCAP